MIDLFPDLSPHISFFGSAKVSAWSRTMAFEFRTLAASAGWGERELHGAYYNGLSEHLLDELSTCELPASLESLVDLTLADRRTSRRLWDPERLRETPYTQSSTSTHAAEAPEVEPMQVEHTRISLSE